MALNRVNQVAPIIPKAGIQPATGPSQKAPRIDVYSRATRGLPVGSAPSLGSAKFFAGNTGMDPVCRLVRTLNEEGLQDHRPRIVMDLVPVVEKDPKLGFISSPSFQILPKEKQSFILNCIEDARFWVELEKKPYSSDGFKFLGAAYALEKDRAEADAQGLTGAEREKFLSSSQSLYTKFNPFGDRRDLDINP